MPKHSHVSSCRSSPVASNLERCCLPDISLEVFDRISKILDSIPYLFLPSHPQLSNQHRHSPAMCPETGSCLQPPFLSCSGVESVSTAGSTSQDSLGPSSVCISSVTSPAWAPSPLPGRHWPMRRLPAFSLSPSNPPPHNSRVILMQVRSPPSPLTASSSSRYTWSKSQILLEPTRLWVTMALLVCSPGCISHLPPP